MHRRCDRSLADLLSSVQEFRTCNQTHRRHLQEWGGIPKPTTTLVYFQTCDACCFRHSRIALWNVRRGLGEAQRRIVRCQAVFQRVSSSAEGPVTLEQSNVVIFILPESRDGTTLTASKQWPLCSHDDLNEES